MSTLRRWIIYHEPNSRSLGYLKETRKESDWIYRRRWSLTTKGKEADPIKLDEMNLGDGYGIV